MRASYFAEFIASGAGTRQANHEHSLSEALRASRIAASRLKFQAAHSREKTATGPKKGYNLRMLVAVFAMRLLEVMFFAGLAGSAVVILISFFEDAKELVGRDEPPKPRA
jgi:hypothetical protein